MRGEEVSSAELDSILVLSRLFAVLSALTGLRTLKWWENGTALVIGSFPFSMGRQLWFVGGFKGLG